MGLLRFSALLDSRKKWARQGAKQVESQRRIDLGWAGGAARRQSLAGRGLCRGSAPAAGFCRRRGAGWWGAGGH